MVFCVLFASTLVTMAGAIHVTTTGNDENAGTADAPLLTIHFLLHNFLLAPLLVYQHKRLPYFAGVVCLLAAFVLFQCQGNHHPKGMDNPPPIHETEFRPEIRDSQAHRDIIDFHGLDEHHGPEGHMGPPPPGNRMPMGGVLEKFFQFLMMVLALGMNLGVKLYFKYQQDQRELQPTVFCRC